jgi:hypothetical protein
MKRLIVPAVTTLLVVVLLIVVNGWNRSGEPPQRITVTQRELPLGWAGPDDRRGARFRIDYEGRYDPFDARNWLTEERLRALGFAPDVMPGAPEAGDTYRRMLPKTAWVAFEYDGNAWRDIERRRELAQSNAENRYSPYPSSRLVPVDASLDRDALLRRYPTGHLVLRASIEIRYLEPGNRGPLVYGYISRIIPGEVSIPRDLADRVRDLGVRGEKGEPRYEVDLAVGHLGIPFVTDVRRLSVPASP